MLLPLALFSVAFPPSVAGVKKYYKYQEDQGEVDPVSFDEFPEGEAPLLFFGGIFGFWQMFLLNIHSLFPLV